MNKGREYYRALNKDLAQKASCILWYVIHKFPNRAARHNKAAPSYQRNLAFKGKLPC